MDQTTLLIGITALGAAFVKGVTGMAFPLFATPVVAVLVDMPTAIAILLAPNILMDGVQILRRRFPLEHLRRLWPMLATGVVGVFLGTYLLVSISERAVILIVAALVFVFVGQSLWATAPAIPVHLEPFISPVVGFATGVLNGVSNTLSPIIALYLISLRLAKLDFVKSIALVFFSFKVAQVVAVWKVNLFTPHRLWLSGITTLFALAGFGAGLRVQDRVNQVTFNRALLGLLTLTGLLLLWKALR